MFRATIVVPYLLFFAISIAAQDRALISGDIEDRQDNPIAGTQVILRNDSLRVERSTVTNSDGLYFFAEVVPAEGYIITSTAAGLIFAPSSVKFDVEVGETRHILPSFIADKAPASTSFVRPQFRKPPGFQQAKLVRPVAFYPGQSTGGQSAPQSSGASASQQPNSAPPMSAGRSAQRNTVEAARAPVESSSTAISTVVTSNQLRNLPFFNRNFLALGLLVSSTHDVPAWSELKDTTFSISGQRPTSNSFMIDGMDNVASSSNQAIPFQVNDAVQEFRVVTSSSDAQFGRNVGGVVNIVTRRGTATFHGSVFGFFATDTVNASSPLSVYNGSGLDQAAAFAGSLSALPAPNTNPSGSPIYQPSSYNQYVKTVQAVNPSACTVPNSSPGSSDCNPLFDPAALLARNDSRTQPFSSQQFGGQAGGSFLKRWYWFGDYEGTRINNPTPIFIRVPSSYDRSHLADFQGLPGYSDAQVAQAVLALYPAANVTAIPDVLEFYRGQAPNYTNVSNYLGRIDFTQSRDTDWTLRYNIQDLSQLHDDTLPASSTYPGNGAQRDVLNQNLVLTFTHRFSDSVSNVLRGGFTRFKVNETPQDANFNTTQAGLPSGAMQTYLLAGLDPQYAGAAPGVNGAWGGWYDAIWSPPVGLPVIAPSLDGLFPFARVGAPLGAPGKRQDTELELVDNVVWFKGRHTIRTGFDLRHLQNVFNNGGFSRGLVVSSNIGEFTSDSETCVTCSQSGFTNPSFDYALKQPSAYNTTFHSYVVAAYLQDTWRLKSNLTINLGIRYEYFSPPSETNHQLWNYDPTANGLVRQDETQVSDTFGNICGRDSSGMASIYGFVPTLPWVCHPNGYGSFVTANTTNFEPRLGVAWSTPSGKTVLRAAFGIYYDEVPVSLMAQLAFNRPTPATNTNPQALYGQNFFLGICPFQQCGLGNASLVTHNAQNPFYQYASVPFGLSAIDPSRLNNPMTRQVSFSIQQQVTPNISAELAYIGNYMANLPVTSNTGFNNEWFCTNSAPGNLAQPCDAFSFVPVFTTANAGYGNYNAFVAKLITRAWHGLQARASYTYSKALDNASSAGAPLIPGPLMTQLNAVSYFSTGNPLIYALGSATTGFVPQTIPFSPSAVAPSSLTGLLTAGVNTTGSGRALVTPYTVPQDPYHFLTNDYGRADFDQTNRFILEYAWEPTFSQPSRWLSGWMLSGVLVAESGQPFTIFSGPIAGELTQRVSLTGPVSTTGNPYQYFANNPPIVLPGATCAALPGAASEYAIQTTVGIRSGGIGTPCLGNSARNQFTGPAYVDYDMAVQKMFKLHERIALALRAESYNLFNHPNYYNPISSFSLDGVSEYSQFGQIKSAHNARQFQFSVRVSW